MKKNKQRNKALREYANSLAKQANEGDNSALLKLELLINQSPHLLGFVTKHERKFNTKEKKYWLKIGVTTIKRLRMES